MPDKSPLAARRRAFSFFKKEFPSLGDGGSVFCFRRAIMTKRLFIGGLVAAGFDPTGAYLLTVSHSGRGVFETSSWERVARDPQMAYPEGGHAIGIGPIGGVSIPVTEIDRKTGYLSFSSPDGKLCFDYGEGTLSISDASV